MPGQGTFYLSWALTAGQCAVTLYSTHGLLSQQIPCGHQESNTFADDTALVSLLEQDEVEHGSSSKTLCRLPV